MRRLKTPVCGILIAAMLFALAAFAACERGHSHSGVLTALRTDDASPIPCCGVFRCGECGETYEATVTYKDAGLPVIRIDGDLTGISKTDKVKAEAVYDGEISFTCGVVLKWQGESSLLYPKKNFSVQFVNAEGKGKGVTLREAWGEESKYCLKANWNDYGGARNLVSAKLWGEIVHSRASGDRLDPLVNGGAVDGYPVLLYINGVFHGLYTMNTPKNRWIFGMTRKDVHEGLLFAEYTRDSVNLQAPIDGAASPDVSGWSVEYCATEDGDEGTGWLFDGMNALISFLNTGDGEAFRAGIGEYTDVDRVIDYMLFVSYICGLDNLGRNVIWVTYDGKKYVPSAYDMDSTWLYNMSLAPGESPSAEQTAGWVSVVRANRLFDRVLDLYAAEVSARCTALRETLLSDAHAEALFSAHLNEIPGFVRTAESERWPTQDVAQNNEPDQTMQLYSAWAAALDGVFGGR